MQFKIQKPDGRVFQTTSIVVAYTQNKFPHLNGKYLANLRKRHTKIIKLSEIVKAASSFLRVKKGTFDKLKQYLSKSLAAVNTNNPLKGYSDTVKAVPYISFL